jgi:hypothetical protein
MRTIKPGFFQNEELAEMEPLACLLFAGLWCWADREGRLEDRPKRLKNEIFPARACDIDALLDQLAAGGFIERYAVDGARYIQVSAFLVHQNPHYKELPSVIPPPPSADGRPTVEQPSADGHAVLAGPAMGHGPWAVHQNPHYKELPSVIPPPPSADGRPTVEQPSADGHAVLAGPAMGHGPWAMGHGVRGVGSGGSVELRSPDPARADARGGPPPQENRTRPKRGAGRRKGRDGPSDRGWVSTYEPGRKLDAPSAFDLAGAEATS